MTVETKVNEDNTTQSNPNNNKMNGESLLFEGFSSDLFLIVLELFLWWLTVF